MKTCVPSQTLSQRSLTDAVRTELGSAAFHILATPAPSDARAMWVKLRPQASTQSPGHRENILEPLASKEEVRHAITEKSLGSKKAETSTTTISGQVKRRSNECYAKHSTGGANDDGSKAFVTRHSNAYLSMRATSNEHKRKFRVHLKQQQSEGLLKLEDEEATEDKEATEDISRADAIQAFFTADEAKSGDVKKKKGTKVNERRGEKRSSGTRQSSHPRTFEAGVGGHAHRNKGTAGHARDLQGLVEVLLANEAGSVSRIESLKTQVCSLGVASPSFFLEHRQKFTSNSSMSWIPRSRLWRLSVRFQHVSPQGTKVVRCSGRQIRYKLLPRLLSAPGACAYPWRIPVPVWRSCAKRIYRFRMTVSKLCSGESIEYLRTRLFFNSSLRAQGIAY